MDTSHLRKYSTPDLRRRLDKWRIEAAGRRQWQPLAAQAIAVITKELLRRNVCVCDMRTRLLGDGCQVCSSNPHKSSKVTE